MPHGGHAVIRAPLPGFLVVQSAQSASSAVHDFLPVRQGILASDRIIGPESPFGTRVMVFRVGPGFMASFLGHEHGNGLVAVAAVDVEIRVEGEDLAVAM